MSCNDRFVKTIPKGWNIDTIENLGEVKGGKRLPKGECLIEQFTPYPYIRLVDIKNNKVDMSNVMYLTEDIQNKISRYIVEKDDVCLAIVGNTIGLVFNITDKEHGFNLTENAARVTNLDKSRINNKFLFYYLKSEIGQYQIISKKVGSAQGKLPIKNVKQIEVLLPPIEEQEKIANILSSLDEKIELNNEMNKTLEEMAQSIFKRWFVNFEFPNEDGKPYKSSGGEMVDSELGMIPKGWEVKELSQLVNIITKSEKPFENEDILYEHFSIPALDSNKLPILEFGNSISSNKYKIDNDCILISKLNPNNKRIWNPYCNTSNSICSTEFIVYKAINNYPKSYIYEIINSDEFTKFLVANATGSTGSRQRVKPKDTLGYKIVLPTIDKIIEIDKILSPIHKNIQLNTQESNTILQIRNILLPKLMSGEIKVN